MKLGFQAACMFFSCLSGQIYANYGWDSVGYFIVVLVASVLGSIVVSWGTPQPSTTTSQ